jgi:hypothetical protein
MKPVDTGELVKIVRKKLDEQDEMENVTEQKVAWWIQTRIRSAEINLPSWR